MPRRIVDCRGCIYFRFPEELNQELLDWCRQWIERHRPGERLLGYCVLYRRPVTYYKGFCSGYTSHTLAPPARKPITYYLDGR